MSNCLIKRDVSLCGACLLCINGLHLYYACTYYSKVGFSTNNKFSVTVSQCLVALNNYTFMLIIVPGQYTVLVACQ